MTGVQTCALPIWLLDRDLDTPIVAPSARLAQEERLASSEFWRNLAIEFRSVRIEKAYHWAEWHSPGPDLPNGWILSEHYPFRMEFLPLALRAAHALIADAPNPWKVGAWGM